MCLMVVKLWPGIIGSDPAFVLAEDHVITPWEAVSIAHGCGQLARDVPVKTRSVWRNGSSFLILSPDFHGYFRP